MKNTVKTKCFGALIIVDQDAPKMATKKPVVLVRVVSGAVRKHSVIIAKPEESKDCE